MTRPITDGKPGPVLLALAVALLVGVAGCDAPQGVDAGLDATLAGSDNPDLSGSWRLNMEDSELPNARPGRRDPRRPDAGRHRRRRGVAPPNGGEGGTRRPGRRLAREFEITQTGSSVTFTGPRGRSVTYDTDGQPVTRDLGEGREIEIEATWSDGALVIRRTMPRGVTTTEIYSLSSDARQLFIDVRIEGGRLAEAIELRRVYDAIGE